MSTMGMKAGTKTWSDKPQVAEKSATEVQQLTAEQKQKIGAEDLNAVLNKAADKNWVDNNKRVQGHGNSQMDKDAFFKLMLAQLKNQDPMNPLKNHEMAAQLAQFSTLEQMTNMNTTLTKMEGQGAQPQDFQALNLIGKTVAGDSSRVVRTQFDKEHDFNFNLPQSATEANVRLMTAKGDLVREYKLSNLQAGNNKVSWNGKNEGGVSQSAGEYVFQVEAKNAVGQKIPVKTEFQGVISGMSFSAEGPVLQVGSQTIKMRDVRQITDSSAKQNDQNIKNSTSLDLKNTDEEAQNNIKQEDTSSRAPVFKPGNVMTDVAMSRDLMNKLQKEMK
jgi:flagellar basal-body rod modification protein FlgD